MTRRKLTGIAFWVADIVCWLMVALSVATLGAAFFPPHISTWYAIELPTGLLVPLEVINSLINGFGFYLLIKRKALGFILIFVTSVVSLAASRYFHIEAIYYLLALFAVVSMPWVLVSREIAVGGQKHNK